MSIHNGHRDRMKKRFQAYGLDGFQPHEVLELLLFYSIPRANTNEISHRLLSTYNSLGEVFEASADDLQKIDGVGENSALLLNLIPSVCRLYLENPHEATLRLLNSKEVGNYLLKQFIGITTEIFILLLMDNAGKVLFCDKIFDGSITAVDVNTRKIIELCLKYNATAAVISHNHPRGNALPSKEDIVSTNELKSALNVISVKLLDHMIISGNEFCSLAEIDGLFG